jgi:hypothetical protein
MTSLGQPVATRVITDSLGQFESLQFFGQRFRSNAAVHPEQEEKYTDERVYWLDIGGSPGLKIDNVGAAPNWDLTPPTDFLTTVHAEESNVWWTLTSGTTDPAWDQIDRWDTWFWSTIQTTPTASVTATLPYTLPYPAAGFPATLRLEEIARSWSDAVNPDHRTVIGINGTRFPFQDWDGKVRKVFTETIPAGVLVSGVNNVTVSAENPPGIASYRVYVNYWEMDYRREFRAWDGQLDFTAENNGPHEYLSSGWGAGPVEVWDISNPHQPKRLVDFAVKPDTEEIRFRADDLTGTRYWLQAVDTIASPISLRVRPPTGLREETLGADAVILAPADLAPAAQQLAGWHADHGRQALVVDIQDVYDEFNDGIYHPKAVPLMLAWAKDHWDPKPIYLTLVGDGHWNFKNYNTAVYPGGPNPIPPYLAWVDPWQGEVPADPLYGDLDFDGWPDVAVGRLAVNTLDEANTVVDKIITYNETLRVQPWQQRALFVADWDYTDPGFPYTYQILSDQIIAGYLPGGIVPQSAYLAGEAEADVAAVKATIVDALQSGVLMVQYSGHGDVYRWSRKSIWNTTDVAGLQNGALLPVVMTFNCKDGYFAYPGTPSVAETMQRQPNGGSIAAISPSGLGAIPEQHAMRKRLMEVIFQDQVRDLGNALLIAKQRYYVCDPAKPSDCPPYYQVATLMLYGDPAMRLPGPLPAVAYMPLVLGTH